MTRWHPSGKPKRVARKGVLGWARPPREGYLVDRLNHQQRTGGFGFRLPEEPEDHMWLETRARRG